MSRGQGRVFRQAWTDTKTKERHTSPFWSLDYSLHGERYREPTGFTSQKKAMKLLRERIGDRENGQLIGDPDSVKVHDLRLLAETQYAIEARRSKDRLGQCWAHLEKFFGADAAAAHIAPTRLDAYVTA